MFYLYVIDYLIGLCLSLLFSQMFFESLEYFYFLLPFILVILSFLREHEAKVKGRLKVIERKEFLKRFDDYDNYVYIVNDKVDNEYNYVNNIDML